MSASAANTRTSNHVARGATSTEQTRTNTLMPAVLNAIYRNPKLSQIYQANLKAGKPGLSPFLSNEVRRNYDTYRRLQDSNGREQEITAVREHTEQLDEELMEELKHTADERIIQIAMEDGGDFSERYKQEAPATNTHAKARPIHADARETSTVIIHTVGRPAQNVNSDEARIMRAYDIALARRRETDRGIGTQPRGSQTRNSAGGGYG
ncbi:hypothetical protein B484DRAFT_406603 [Ochromonadaceae sp. CCMP2298]|nr:hypothetical protein B484DRAFT_406603 [Ochromonadaceae sp. CCMP2298]